jgi:hypothetical protein
VFIFRQAHKARVQTGDGFELAIKRANPKVYSSSYVEIFGTLQVRLQTKKSTNKNIHYILQPDLSIMEVRARELNF